MEANSVIDEIPDAAPFPFQRPMDPQQVQQYEFCNTVVSRLCQKQSGEALHKQFKLFPSTELFFAPPISPQKFFGRML